MGREIEFRAKKTYANEWVYGSGVIPVFENGYKTNEMKIVKKVCYDELSNYEAEYVSFKIKPETVGQYTGVKDKNGVKIFEGDIVNTYEVYNPIYKVEWDEEMGGWRMSNGFDYKSLWFVHNYKVIGNIYENKELLKNE